MDTKTMLITGANSGIGFATANHLAKQGHLIIMVCRNVQKGAEARQHIMDTTGNQNIDLLVADLSSQHDIRKLAAEVEEGYPSLDVLINNAGGVFGQYQVNSDGFEMTFAVNYLAPFLLTQLLLNKLKASEPARIVNVASIVQDKHFQPKDAVPQTVSNYSGMQAYKTAKTAVLMMTYYMSKALENSGVTINALHPGFIYTPQATRMAPKMLRPIMKLFSKSPEQGADTSVYLAASNDIKGVSGKFFKDNKVELTAPVSYNEDIQKILYTKSMEWTGLNE
ncbi:SDR family oxidoreductase [Gracilibacillus timonensis]|uniref:SDR family oxidoreductase n=1 Tax=Gracilibacillus timonensis TaxID=1816696 RepID=UPI0008243003|nr:SDR family oxidoreductase [Gracilibacillus timonensis]